MSTTVVENPGLTAIGNAPTACHLFPLFGSARHAYCGVPREEQEFHHIPDFGKDAPICPTCGRQRCRMCAAEHRRHYG